MKTTLRCWSFWENQNLLSKSIFGLMAFFMLFGLESNAQQNHCDDSNVTQVCDIFAYEPGDHALWLPSLPGSTEDYVFDSDGGEFVVYNDGTAHITGTVERINNSDKRWVVDIWLENERTWAEWSALGRDYKDEQNFNTGEHVNWKYYEMNNSTSKLYGAGDFAGETLHLAHMPADYEFGFQCGLGANSKNLEWGISGWFTHTGSYDGHGDVNVNKDCEDCPPQVLCEIFAECDGSDVTTHGGSDGTLSPIIFGSGNYDIEWTGPNGFSASTLAIDNLEAGCYMAVITDLDFDDCEYILECAISQPADCEEGTYRTQTPGGWGSPASGNNPGAYRDANFDGAFPSGLTVGCDGGFELHLSSASDVQNFLPSGGTPAALTQNYTNPGNTLGNTFAGHLVALTLSVGFDNYDPAFADSDFLMEGLFINGGVFDGMTVADFLELANNVFGGCDNSYTPSDITGTLTDINESYVDGEDTGSILDCSSQECVGELFLFCDLLMDVDLECGESTHPDNTGYPAYQDPYQGDPNCPEIDTLVWVDNVTGTCPEIITRTWTLSDTDGNTSVCEQTITVNDTVAPTFDNFPEDLEVDCPDDVPNMEQITASDNCDDDVNVVCFESIQSEEGSGNCEILNMDWDGESAPRVGWLPQMPGTVNPDKNLFSLENGTMERFDDGTAHFYGVMSSIHNDQLAWEFDLWLTGGYDWDEWSGMGRDYKDDQNIAGSNYEDWIYYELDGSQSTLTGIRDYAGSLLNLTHAPTDYNYGFQLGQNSNVFTETFGMSGWFLMTGEIHYNGNIHDRNGVMGDFNVDLDCEEPNFEDECVYTIVRTCIATDDCGNTTTQTQTIEVEDLTPPTIECPDPITVDCFENIPAPDTSLVTAFDNCSNVTITWEGDDAQGEFCDGQVIRTYRATDECGNWAECTQIITHIDSVPPVFDFQPQDLTIQCGDDVPAMEEILATDNCSGDITYTMASSISLSDDCPTIEVISRSWTATDVCGNETTISQTITIQDNEAPTIECPEDTAVVCYADVPEPNVQLVSADDECSDVIVTWEGDEMDGDECAGTITRTYRATDDCGNFTECTHIITYNDDEAPELIMPADTSVTAYCGFFQADDAQAYLNGEMTPEDSTAFVAYVQSLFANQGLIPQGVEDNCDPQAYWEEISIEILTDVDCPMIYQINCNFQAFDNCGNESEVETTYLFIEDDQPPVIECPDDIEVDCPEDVPAPNVQTVTAFDDCSEVVITWEGDASDIINCEGTILRTYRATDECGNYVECTQTITFNDDEAPVFDFEPQDLTIECGEEVPPMEEIPATDNCDDDVEITMASSISMSDDCPTIEIISRSWTATDDCGNSTTISQTIYIQDTGIPTITCPDDVEVECYDDVPEPNVQLVTADDDCSDVIVTWEGDEMDGDECSGTIIRTYRATDACGNYAECTQTFTYEDTEDPVFEYEPQDITVECGEEVPPMEEIPATDNCDDDVEITMASSISMSDDCPTIEIISRSWTATDDCGNSTTISQTIYIQDTGIPTITCPDDVEVECYDDVPEPNVQLVTADDDCSDVIVTWEGDEMDGDECSGTIIRTYRAADACGNYAECTQTITYADTLAPEFNETIEDLHVQCPEDVPPFEECTATDNCDDDVEIWSFEFPLEAGDSTCVLTDAIGPGVDWSIVLFNLPGATDYYLFNEPGTMQIYNDGSAIITGTVVANNNPAQQWDVFIRLENKRNWTDWSALGRDYKDDLNLAGSNYLDWSYYEMDNNNSFLIGAGDFAGSFLQLSHLPVNYLFGFQCGIAANNKNANFGLSGWFHYDGFLNGTPVNGQGDVNVDKECEENNFETECVYDIERFWIAMDDCGNTNIANQTITVEDTTPPEFTEYPNDWFFACIDDVPAPDTSLFVAEDNCDGIVDVEFLFENTSGDDCEATITRVYVAADKCGNDTTIVHTITVADTIAPVLSGVPADTDASCDNIPAVAVVTATDNCDESVNVIFNQDSIPGQCPQNYTLIRTWTATDSCGNEVEATQVINVSDEEAPVITECAPDMFYACYDSIPEADISLIAANDNCGMVTITHVGDSLVGDDCEGVIYRTYRATDECFNYSECVQVITYNDTIAPTFDNAPENITVDCANVPDPMDVTASDNCDSDVYVEFSEIEFSGGCPGVLERTWVATDDCGNSATHVQYINLIDTVAPTLHDLPADATYECSDSIPAPAEVTATDNCDDAVLVEYTQSDSAGDCPQEYTIYRTWTATDTCENTVSHTQVINIVDTTAPVFNMQDGEVTVECYVDVEIPEPSATDNCDELVDISLDVDSIAGNCPNEWTMVYTWTATDDCENSADLIFTVNYVDNNDPVFTDTPDDWFFDCIEDVPAADTDLLAAVDSCGDVTITHVGDEQDGDDCEAVIARTYRATDECGNYTDYVQTITVADSLAPVLSGVPADVDASCDNVPAVANVTATDNCDESVMVVFNQDSIPGNCPYNYTLIRTWSATDSCGNYVEDVQVIEVSDEEAPVITECAPDMFYVCYDSIPEADISLISANDNCGMVTITHEGDSLAGDDCEGVIYRTYRATDECFNYSECVQVITYNDTIAPVFVDAPQNITVDCADVPDPMDIEAVDNCGGDVSIEFSEIEFSGGCPGVLERTWVATDDCGNSATHIQYINLIDTIAPTLHDLPADATYECSDSIPAPAEVTATDNCDDAVLVEYTQSDSAGDCPQEYTIYRTWTATDTCENTVSHTQVINIVDTTAPVFNMQDSEVTVECYVDVEIPEPSATDNCDELVDISLDVDSIAGNCPNEWTMVYTWTATDDCENSADLIFTVNYVDNNDPVFTQTPDDWFFACIEDVPAADTGLLAAIDSCGDVTITHVGDEQDGDDCEAVILRTYRATDECDNFTDYVQTITVADTLAPVLSGVPADATASCDNVPAAANVTATDNCDEAVIVAYNQDSIPGQCPYNYTLIRTWSATDSCGNYVEDMQVIEVSDEEAPVITECAPDMFYECFDNIPEADISLISAEDNCGMVTITHVGDSLAGDECEGVIYRTYRATDECFNYSECVQVITYNDTIAPVFVDAPQNITVDCDNVPDPMDIEAMDNCDSDVSIVFSEIEFSGGCPGVLERTWVATDDCGNSATHVQYINLIDTIAPTLHDLPADATYECTDSIPAPADVTATDNCDAAVVVEYTESDSAGSCPQEYTIYRTWTATDTCENTVSHTQIINVIDTVAPVFTSNPEDLYVQCPDDVPEPEELEATDNCSDSVTVSFFEIPGPLAVSSVTTAFGDNYALEISTFINGSDEYAFQEDATFTEYVNGTARLQGEVISTTYDQKGWEVDIWLQQGADWEEWSANGGIYVDENGLVTNEYNDWSYYEVNPVMSKLTGILDYDGFYLNLSQAAYPENHGFQVGDVANNRNTEWGMYTRMYTNGFFDGEMVTGVGEIYLQGNQGPQLQDECSYEITRIWTATDECGNSSTVQQVILVEDTIAPEFTVLPEDMTYLCDEEVEESDVEAVDNCGQEVNIFFTDLVVDGECDNEYTIERTWVAEDNCLNRSYYLQIINVVDTIAPVLSGVPADADVSCDNVPTAANVTATDNCDESVNVIFNQDSIPGQCPYNYTLIRTWSATDSCGNYVEDMQVIEVSDEEAPVITECAPDMFYECYDNIPEADISLITAEDNCGMVTITHVGDSLAGDECEGVIYRTYRATDECNLYTECVQVITYNDTIAPTFDNAPENMTVDCANVPDPMDVTASDNCDEDVTIDFSEIEFSGGCPGVLERTWVATDDCGNSATHVQYINLIDTIAPTLHDLPADATYECSDSIPAPAEVTATDNCDDAVLVEYTVSDSAGDCPQEYTIYRTWTATDTCENTVSHTQVINIVDTTAPVFNMQDGEVTVECYEDVEIPEPSASDLCDELVDISLDVDTIAGNCPNEWTVVYTWTATDDCENSSDLTYIVNYVDNNDPVFTDTPDDWSFACIDEVPAANTGLLTAIDSCGDVTITHVGDEQDGDDCEAVISRTYRATDECGNTTDYVQTITVADTIAPVLSGVPADATASCDNVPAAAVVTATDNCDEAVNVVYNQDSIPGNCPQNYTLIRTWSATDSCGNYVEDMQVIEVSDEEAPVITECAPDMFYACYDSIPEADISLIVAEDNCGMVTITHQGDSLAGDECEGVIYRTYRATDECNHYSECVQVITFNDTIAPTFDNAPAPAISVDCANIPDPAEVTASDNCDQDVMVEYTEILFSGGCPGVLQRIWTATDDCGNSVTTEQFITLVDTVAPELHNLPDDMVIACHEEMPDTAEVWATDNCNASVDVEFDQSIEQGNCPQEYTIYRTWTATDSCDNSTSHTQVINVVDTLAPVFGEVEAEIHLECYETADLDQPEVWDLCDTALTVELDVDSIAGVCANEWSEVYTWTATDACGNSSSVSTTVFYHDNNDPIFTSVPEDMFVACYDDVPAANPNALAAWDSCGTPEITHIGDSLIGSTCDGMIYRTYRATDECDNFTDHVQIITVADTLAPTFDQSVEDMTVECDQVPDAANITASDNCDDDVQVVFNEETEDGECANSYTLIRTWTATDDCGNDNVLTQIITVEDNTAPVFVDLPEDASYDCNDSIPALEDCLAVDNCSDTITYTAEEFIEGYTGEDGLAQCELFTPLEVIGAAWAVWLPNNIGEPQYYYLTENSGSFVELPNGRAHLTGTVYAPANPNKRWVIDVYFKDRADWDEWNGLGRSYKDDANVAGDNYLDWDYYILNADSAVLTGAGLYAGSELDLSHAPASFYFGFQVGLAANNRNDADGMSGWFFYDGTWIGNEGVNGIGDFGFEKDCPECDYTITRIWTATDDCGNTNTGVQVITVTDQGDENEDLDVVNLNKAPGIVLGAWPNPMTHRSTITFEIPETSRVTLEVFNMDGKLIETLYQGEAAGEQEYFFQFNAQSLSNGLYLYKLTTDKAAYIDKLMIAR